LPYFTNLGEVLKVGDCNEDGNMDLIIGMPSSEGGFGAEQSGTLAVFLSSPTYKIGGNLVMDIAKASWAAKGPEADTWFGNAVEFVHSKNGNPAMIIVGTPSAGRKTPLTTIPGTGRIYAYELTADIISKYNPYAPHNVKPLFVLEGMLKYGHLGASLAVVNIPRLSYSPILAASLPTLNSSDLGISLTQAGAVVLLDLQNLVKMGGDITLDQASPITTIMGINAISRFGAVLKFVSLLNNTQEPSLFVTEPLYGVLDHGDVGQVYHWAGGSLTRGKIGNPANNATTIFRKNPINNNMGDNARFGSYIEFADLDASGKLDIIISSPRDSSVSYLGGSVDIIFN